MTHKIPNLEDHLDPFTEPTDFGETNGNYIINTIPGFTVFIPSHNPDIEGPDIQVYKTSTLLQWSAEATAGTDPPIELPDQYVDRWSITDEAANIKSRFGPNKIKALIKLLEQG